MSQLDSRFVGSPAALVEPGAHASHPLPFPRKSTSHAQKVAPPVASSPAARDELSGHARHAWLSLTCSLMPHTVTSHAVSAIVASSPAAFVEPGSHGTHALLTTCSFDAHRSPSQV